MSQCLQFFIRKSTITGIQSYILFTHLPFCSCCDTLAMNHGKGHQAHGHQGGEEGRGGAEQ